MFVFTADKNDIITNASLKQIVESELTMSVRKAKMILIGKGAKAHRNNKSRGLKCLKLANDDDDEDENDLYYKN